MEKVKAFLAGLLKIAGETTLKQRTVALVVFIAVAASAYLHQHPERFSPVKEKAVSALSAVEHKAKTVTHDVTTECRDGLLTIDGTVVSDGIGNPVACSCQVVLD